VASIDENNNPTVTPIGSLFLRKNHTGFYFEKFPSRLPKTAENRNICVLSVNSSTTFWIKALFRMKFKTHPAIKLYGKLGDRREATKTELMRLRSRMKATRLLKGNKYLWDNMPYIREIVFERAEGINLGIMTGDLG
jgi:hypothetical protein